MAHNIPAVPSDLVEAVVQRRAVLFAGAGISRGELQSEGATIEHYLPTWGGLLKVLIDRAVQSGQVRPAEGAKLRQAVNDDKFLFVAEAVRSKLGMSDYESALEELFRDVRLRPGKRHNLITQIPWSAIVTTNYDKLIEFAYALAGNFPPTYTFHDSPDLISAVRHNRFFVLKAHGDIDRKDTIVLSERDYRDLIYRSPGYRAALNALFMTRTVLFLGASLTDMDVKLVLESVSEAFGGKGPHHYALLPAKEAGDAESLHWRDFFGIRLLRYTASKGHPEIDVFLADLKTKVAEKS
jgi:hypothetical protein